MLILSRKPGEKIYVGNDIIVTVVGLSRGRVRIGFDCPGQIPVHREEVYRRICAEQHTEQLPRSYADFI